MNILIYIIFINHIYKIFVALKLDIIIYGYLSIDIYSNTLIEWIIYDNEEELKNGTSISASWLQEYNDTSYIYIGSLPFEVTELDILTIFSQYGVPRDLKISGYGWCWIEKRVCQCWI